MRMGHVACVRGWRDPGRLVPWVAVVRRAAGSSPLAESWRSTSPALVAWSEGLGRGELCILPAAVPP